MSWRAWFGAAWRFLCWLVDILVPRFITEDVAMHYIAGNREDFSSYQIVCSMVDVMPGEVFDAVATVDGFGWLGFGVHYRIGNFRHWPGQHH